MLGEAAADWGRAADAIARGLRGGRELPSWQRRFCGDAVHEVIRFRRKLAAAAGSEAPGALLDAFLDGAAERRVSPETAVELSYPDWMVEALRPGFGDETEALLRAMNARAPLAVRTNRLKCTREQLAERLAGDGIATRPCALAPDGLVLETRRNVYDMAPLRDGWMEVQDEGSQLVAEATAPPPRGTVIDACAGAGGKTLALAALLGGKGRLTALDVRAHALDELRRRARRAGVTNMTALAVDEGAATPALPPADRVLVDAPCTGTGVLRRHPEAKWRLSPRDVEELAAKQRALLARFAPLVRAGGRLVYATCSLLPVENDGAVADFLAAHPAFEPVPLKEILGRERALALGDGERLRLAPHRHGTDGFFAAVLRRR